jgi:glycosyltransferase involved in cell wall biosynthesis
MMAHDGPVPGGSNWVRLQQSRPHVGYDSVTGLMVFHPERGFGIIDWHNQTHYNCSLIVAQRLMFKDLAEKIDQRKKFNQIIINDVDDWYWGLHKDNHAYRLTHPDFNKDENIAHYKHIVQECDGVVASTPFLADKMKNEFKCENVFLVENHVEVKRFNPRRPNMKKTVVGWVGSTSHRSGDLETIAPVLDNRKFRLHHSGHVNTAEWFADKVGLPRDKVTKAPMYDPRDYARLSFQFDIGIAPLNDVPFNHAKSWIKAIEYAAAGVPFVASDLGEYRRLYETYGIGRTASTHEEWTKHLEELCDLQVRTKEAKEQREKVQEVLDVPLMGKKWRKVFDEYL